MSRPPKTRQLHILEGTLKPSRHNTNTPRPRPVAPRCPPWLDRRAKAHWRQLAPILERNGLLTEADGDAFAQYCATWSLWRRCIAQIAAEGVVITGHRKAPRKHPSLTPLGQAERTLLALGPRFGLDPLSRSRMSLPEPTTEERLLDEARMLD
jgi:P27 family predicted phage terminase small subunit